MRHFAKWLPACFATFFLGLAIVKFWLLPWMQPVNIAEVRQGPVGIVTPFQTTPSEKEPPPGESPGSKAVRLAEQFIADNGYTDLPPNRGRLSYENVEYAESTEEMLGFRHDTLERHAYGYLRGGHGSNKGWTVVFLHKRCFDDCKGIGRAVTMNENFGELLVEHKSFVLKYVEKKLPKR
jgi:hypothetical protein